MDTMYNLIEISDEEDYLLIDHYITINNSDIDNKSIILSPTEYTNKSQENLTYVEIIIDNIQQESDPKIKEFVEFCIKKKLFDDGFYDYNNIFSTNATKLLATFDLMSINGDDIKKDKFIEIMTKKYKYKGDIHYIYNLMDKAHNGYITVVEFQDFFFYNLYKM